MKRLFRRITGYITGKGIGGETIRYVIVGGLTTLVNFGVFFILHEVLTIGANVSNVISISVSILFAYIANKLIVFKQHSTSFSELVLEFLKFVGSRLVTMALEIGIVAAFDAVGWNATVGKAVSVVFVVIVNYFISKLLVFRKKP